MRPQEWGEELVQCDLTLEFTFLCHFSLEKLHNPPWLLCPSPVPASVGADHWGEGAPSVPCPQSVVGGFEGAHTGVKGFYS